jgi:hypothetical protein
MYEKILSRWVMGKLTESQIDLFVKTGWLTHEQGEVIKATPR